MQAIAQMRCKRYCGERVTSCFSMGVGRHRSLRCTIRTSMRQSSACWLRSKTESLWRGVELMSVKPRLSAKRSWDLRRSKTNPRDFTKVYQRRKIFESTSPGIRPRQSFAQAIFLSRVGALCHELHGHRALPWRGVRLVGGPAPLRGHLSP